VVVGAVSEEVMVTKEEVAMASVAMVLTEEEEEEEDEEVAIMVGVGVSGVVIEVDTKRAFPHVCA
jgi:hypothetical protein